MKGLAKIFIRILSIYFIVKAIQIIPLYISTTMTDDVITGNSSPWLTGYYIGMVAIQIVISVLLWVFADPMANFIAGKRQDDSVNLNAQSLQAVAFSVVGVILIVNAIPNIVTNAYTILDVYARAAGSSMMAAISKNIGEIIGSAIKLLLGIWLMFGSNGIVHFIKKLQNTASNDEADDHDLQIGDENQGP